MVNLPHRSAFGSDFLGETWARSQAIMRKPLIQMVGELLME